MRSIESRNGNMLWPFVAPFKITLALFGVLVIAVTLLAPKFRWHQFTTFLVSLGLAAFCFVPGCLGVKALLDLSRCGIFKHAPYAEIQDPRVERYLPPTIHDITLYEPPGGNGFRENTASRRRISSGTSMDCGRPMEVSQRLHGIICTKEAELNAKRSNRTSASSAGRRSKTRCCITVRLKPTVAGSASSTRKQRKRRTSERGIGSDSTTPTLPH